MDVNLNENLCEEKIYKTIFLYNYKLLRNYLNYKFKNSEIVEDCVQNAFLILWENCGKIKPIQAKKFLFTTSYRLALNHCRREKVERKYKESHSEEEVDNFGPDLIYDENVLNKKINDAILKLPEKQKLVFVMNRFENQTYREIAVLLGISVKAVEKRMHNALISMKEALK